MKEPKSWILLNIDGQDVFPLSVGGRLKNLTLFSVSEAIPNNVINKRALISAIVLRYFK